MEKRIACGDVVPGCKAVLTAPTKDELLRRVVAHAAEAHGVKDVTPEISAKVERAIEDVD